MQTLSKLGCLAETPHCLYNKGLGSWVFTALIHQAQQFASHQKSVHSLQRQPTPNTHFLTGRKEHVQNEYKETKTRKPQES